MASRRRTAAAVVAAVLVGGSAWGLLRSQSAPEDVKAAFLFQFTRFVAWPATAFRSVSDPWRIAVLGDHPVHEVLDHALRDKRVENRPFQVVRASEVADLRGAHVVFVPEGQADRLGEVLAALRGTSALVVGESPDFAARGGSVNFVLENRRIRLEVNPEAAGAAGLKVSSKLLQLARVVRSP